ncbi:hypothetical protein HanXRQr2_Chr03g0127231 [Helianthus annuus]|uniref:Uncharacterized protein n=1 Tax=Helianthus annuus TaxID=4232 RepID=A0A9K3JIJ4_HELAN|nr:hypothetical protein HanXRQr2_Chr03g0127231 [Helianthus annuus]
MVWCGVVSLDSTSTSTPLPLSAPPSPPTTPASPPPSPTSSVILSPPLLPASTSSRGGVRPTVLDGGEVGGMI